MTRPFDPSAVATLNLLELAALMAAASSRLAELASVKPEAKDRLLKVTEAAMSEWWLHAHARELPFVVKVGSRTRYSENGMREWARARLGA